MIDGKLESWKDGKLERWKAGKLERFFHLPLYQKGAEAMKRILKMQEWTNWKKTIIIVLALLVMVSIVQPPISSANTELDRLQKKMDEIKAQQAASEQQSKRLEQNIASVRAQEASTVSEMNRLENEILVKENEMEMLSLQISETETIIEITSIELQAAEQRVADRNGVLKARVRSMYENGKVTYMEVLLGANSFVDFLNRFEALNMIVDQDKRILYEHQADREAVVIKKRELEEHHFDLNNFYASLEEARDDLIENERKQKVQLASLQTDRAALHRMLDAEEAALQRLVNELNETLREFRRVYRGTGVFGWPLDDLIVTSPYGNRTNPFGTGRIEWHNGVDFRAPVGTPIYAAEDGVVVRSGWIGGFGRTIIIDHGSGITSLYAHNSQLLVNDGTVVKNGDKIALAGATGNVTGPHLHFTIYEDGKDVNPSNYVKW